MASGSAHLGTPFVLAIAIHKIPEGLALGAMLRLSSQGAGEAVGLLLIAELPTVEALSQRLEAIFSKIREQPSRLDREAAPNSSAVAGFPSANLERRRKISFE